MFPGKKTFSTDGKFQPLPTLMNVIDIVDHLPKYLFDPYIFVYHFYVEEFFIKLSLLGKYRQVLRYGVNFLGFWEKHHSKEY